MKPGSLLISLWCLSATGLVAAQVPRQSLGDPFVQVTSAIAACPMPSPSLYTPDEARAQSHYRAERGTDCYLSGRCRLSNAYAYDTDIISRVQKYIRQDPRFANTSLWIEGQRRWVTLMGCVSTAQQQAALESAVRMVDDVENVVSVLTIVAPAAK